MTDAPQPAARLGMLPALLDVALAVAAVLLSAWASTRGGTAPVDRPRPIVASTAATTPDATIRIDADNVVRLGEKALAAGELDAELRAQKPRSVRIVAAGDSLHAALREVLAALERQGVAEAHWEGGP